MVKTREIKRQKHSLFAAFALGIIFGFSSIGGPCFCTTRESHRTTFSNPTLLDFSPSTKEVVVNVGSNLDPIMPSKEMGPCAHAIAIEPIVGCEIPPHPQLSIIPAAVGRGIRCNVYAHLQ